MHVCFKQLLPGMFIKNSELNEKRLYPIVFTATLMQRTPIRSADQGLVLGLGLGTLLHVFCHSSFFALDGLRRIDVLFIRALECKFPPSIASKHSKLAPQANTAQQSQQAHRSKHSKKSMQAQQAQHSKIARQASTASKHNKQAQQAQQAQQAHTASKQAQQTAGQQASKPASNQPHERGRRQGVKPVVYIYIYSYTYINVNDNVAAHMRWGHLGAHLHLDCVHVRM